MRTLWAWPLTVGLLCAQVDFSALKELKYRNIGPFRGGRAVAVAGVTTQPATYYFGATGGGIWKTTDSGASWTPISDGQVKSGSVGALAVSESDPNVIYAGMGEACVRGNAANGDGVYKSVDSGKTWKHIGLADTYHIGRIVDSSAQSGHRLRSGGRAPVRAQRGARRLPLHGRREDLEEGAIPRCRHRRGGPGHGPVQSQPDLRDALADSTQAVDL